MDLGTIFVELGYQKEDWSDVLKMDRNWSMLIQLDLCNYGNTQFVVELPMILFKYSLTKIGPIWIY